MYDGNGELFDLHSNMDRLKRTAVTAAENAGRHLHSNMDRLKQSKKASGTLGTGNLHSNMDRLKRAVFMR